MEFYNLQNSCHCFFGQFLSLPELMCKTCADKCESCTESDSQCLSCREGFSYDGSECKKCDDFCKTCNTTNPTACFSCPPNAYLYKSGQCLLSCETHFVIRSCPHPTIPNTDLNGTMTCKSLCEQPGNKHLIATIQIFCIGTDPVYLSVP